MEVSENSRVEDSYEKPRKRSNKRAQNEVLPKDASVNLNAVLGKSAKTKSKSKS